MHHRQPWASDIPGAYIKTIRKLIHLIRLIETSAGINYLYLKVKRSSIKFARQPSKLQVALYLNITFDIGFTVKTVIGVPDHSSRNKGALLNIRAIFLTFRLSP
jgi:hypothetical protein